MRWILQSDDRMTTTYPVLALVGPTGTGKSELGLRLAERLDAEIVNCDSRQVYRYLDVGTAKPTTADRAARPHHLFDVVDPDEAFDCARYRALARAAIDAIQARRRPVVLIGGSGLYLKALRFGLAPAPPRDAALRARLEALEAAAPGTLYRRLLATDPAAAARLHPHDRLRLVRALEVGELTGRPLSAWQREHAFRAVEVPVRTIALRLERAALYARLDARCRAMVEGGLVDEVQEVWRRGYGPALPPLQSIGYREIGAYLRGRCGLAEAIADMQRATRQFAKRQMTWFRADPTVEWVDAESVTVEQLAEVPA
jgi:tRNA dimethylallyltransferase